MSPEIRPKRFGTFEKQAPGVPDGGLFSVICHGLGGQMLGDISYTKLLYKSESK